MNLPIVAQIGGQTVPRDEVRAWELDRARVVARKLGMRSPTTDLAELNRYIIGRKPELGHAGIERLLSRELRVAEFVAVGSAALSRGRRRFCTIELTSHAGAAEDVPCWCADAIAANDEEPLIGACPDHYLSRTNPDGTREIIETTGGSPFAIRMFFDDSDTTSIITPVDPTFPTQWVSVARTAGGTAIGGVRHQFRDQRGSGFHVRLTVEFPLTFLTIAAHRWHLACEFSNWIETVCERRGCG
jgi:hypothetical protein